MEYQDDVLKQMNKSGFPFQLRVEQEIRATHSNHGWSIASHEHPWTNPETGSSGFIDIVLQHDRFVTYRLIIECKRMRATDSRQLRWLFLLPDKDLNPTRLATCLEVKGRATQEKPWKDIRIWDDVRLKPQSLESEFCILPNDEPQRQPILESLAGEVLESVEGLAQEEVKIGQSKKIPSLCHFLIPAIVTNAEIVVCHFKSHDIRLSDGTLDPSDAEMSSVPFLRFRKSLASGFPSGMFYSLQDAQKARERTVFIVNAASISDFLTDWQIDALDFDGFAIKRYDLDNY